MISNWSEHVHKRSDYKNASKSFDQNKINGRVWNGNKRSENSVKTRQNYWSTTLTLFL